MAGVSSRRGCADGGGDALGPTGRGLCVAVACSLNHDVGPALYASEPGRCHDLVRVLNAVHAAPVSEWRDPLAFAEPMDLAVSNAMYWQEPPQEDVVAADPIVLAALRPVAEAIAEPTGISVVEHATRPVSAALHESVRRGAPCVASTVGRSAETAASLARRCPRRGESGRQ